jgi:hypothetical protein
LEEGETNYVGRGGVGDGREATAGGAHLHVDLAGLVERPLEGEAHRVLHALEGGILHGEHCAGDRLRAR